MARNIEEFLRRAAERRKQQQQNQPPAQQPPRARRVIEAAEVEIVDPVEVVRPVKPKPPRTATNKKPCKPLQQQKEIRERKARREEKAVRDQSISDHVRQHIDTRDVSDHADHLGERIQNVDDVVQARIHRKFDHDVGQLDDRPTVQDDVVASVESDDVSRLAADLLGMLSNPESVRQAILVSEILSRPNFD